MKILNKLALLGMLTAGAQLAGANTQDSVVNGQSDLTQSATFATAPTTASDVTFTNTTYNPTAFTLNTNGFNLSIGTLDDLDATQTLTIQNTTGGSTSTITLNGGTNAVSGTAGDIFYVASGGTLSIGGGAGTLNLALAATGNFNIVGTANIGSVISGATFGFTKTGAGTLTLSGANTYTGTTAVSVGTLVNGSATTFTSKGALSLSNSATFDLGGFNAAFTNLAASNSANVVTNNGASDATLTLAAYTATTSSLYQDGSKKLGVRIGNGNFYDTIFTNANNTFSGGVTLLGTGGGTRLRIDGTTLGTVTGGVLTKGIFGTGTISVGVTAADKAGIIFTNTNTLANAVTVNTVLGTDFAAAIRLDNQAIVATISGTLTLNATGNTFGNLNSGNTPRAALTGQVTGSGGLGINLLGGGAVVVSLSNPTANGNNYVGDTTIGTVGTGGLGTNLGTLRLGAADQIPNGTNTGNVTVNAYGTLDLGGFSETINGLSGALTTGTPKVDGNSGAVSATATTSTLTVGDNNATGFTFAGVIQNTVGTLNLVKIGTGTQTLSGANTYTGTTTVNGGTLLIAGSTVAGSAFTVNNSGSVLGGTGTINGTVAVNTGSVITGATRGTSRAVTAANVGRLNTGALTLTSGSTFHFDLLNNGNTAGTSYDQVNVTGTVDLGGSTLEGSVASGLTPTIGQTLLLIANDGTDAITGIFTGVAEGSTVALDGFNFTASYVGGTGNDFVLTATAVAVPEPATWAAGCLLLGVMVYSQRRQIRAWLRPA